MLFERGQDFGGNAGSFQLDGHWLDYGSHRLHPACDPAVLADVRAFLGPDLHDRPRHGRIRLLGKWVHFPLKPLDLLLHLDRSFAAGALTDAARKLLPRRGTTGEENFATVLAAGLGRTICEHFYFPYARKIWGAEPAELSAIQARRRVSAGSFTKLLRKVLGQVPGLKPPGAGRFFYPEEGFGQISRAYGREAARLGAELNLGWTVVALERSGDTGGRWTVTAERAGERRSWAAEHLWSTLPISILARLRRPAAPPAVLEAAASIDYRAMLLVYLELPVGRFSEYDAHYFPGEDVGLTRLSEPKNYAARTEPRDSTVLCAEIPCQRGDELWGSPEAELGRRVAEDLERSDLPLPAAPSAVHVRRLPQAYPIYRSGYEEPFGVLDRWALDEPGLVTYGRQGLFAHDNTHHALYMAYAAADSLRDGSFDAARWRAHREVFATHVVED